MWMLKGDPEGTRVSSGVSADRFGVPTACGAGIVARNRVTILERVEPGSVSLDARDQARILVVSRRQMKQRTSLWTIGGARLDDHAGAPLRTRRGMSRNTQRMAEVIRLLTFVDIDDRDARGLSVSALHQAVLDDGRRVVLLDDRGWTSSRGAAKAPLEDVNRTARVVVGPDEPFGDRSQTDMEVLHWEALVRALREHGVVTDLAKLRELPHAVEVSDRVLALADAESAEEPR
jgi:ADP-ribose pyrophosphatase YjhB (NUDIX family)